MATRMTRGEVSRWMACGCRIDHDEEGDRWYFQREIRCKKAHRLTAGILRVWSKRYDDRMCAASKVRKGALMPHEREDLKLAKVRRMANGMVLRTYVPAAAGTRSPKVPLGRSFYR